MNFYLGASIKKSWTSWYLCLYSKNLIQKYSPCCGAVHQQVMSMVDKEQVVTEPYSFLRPRSPSPRHEGLPFDNFTEKKLVSNTYTIVEKVVQMQEQLIRKMLVVSIYNNCVCVISILTKPFMQWMTS